ncbi:MAG: hypothetical protein K9L17_06460 [Clostridiales bacterium]|nr:hypothetical protein [Clostridiales bacterium]MCF8022314.1 hypothetical protein [Clostridiales bacterium]
MVITLLAITFLIAFLVSFITVRIFRTPLERILKRLIPEDISYAWLRYLQFAIYVVGISRGVEIWQLEKYITPQNNIPEKSREIIMLNADRWALEIYRTIIGTLSGIAWMLLVFFVFALVAYVIVRIFESRKLDNKK